LARKNHRFGIVLKSEKSKAETFEELQKSIDVAVLNDADVFIMSWDFDKSTDKKTSKDEDESSISKNKFLSFIRKKAPGIAAFLKGRKWWHIYIGFAAVVLTLQFIRNLLT